MNTQLRITDLQLPPPSAIAALKDMQLLIDQYRVPLLIETPHPNAICLLNYPSGFIEQLPQWLRWKTYFLPYYGRRLELAIVLRVQMQKYLDSKHRVNLFPLIFRRGNPQFLDLKEPLIMTKTAPAKNVAPKTSAAPKNVKPGQGTETVKLMKVTPSKQNPDTILSQPKYVPTLQSTYKGIDGKTREIGFMALTVKNMLNWLRYNESNRPVNWSHVKTLMEAWLSDWVDDANIYVMSFLNNVADGQHRPIAFVLAFGNRDEVSDLLRMISSWKNSGWTLGKEIEPTKLMGEYVPIKNYALSNKGIDANRFIPVLLNSDPRVADKADTDQKKRTGADQLTRNQDSSNMLAKWDLAGTELQTILRYMYLRVLPPTQTAKDGGSNYGSIRKSGNIHPDRYPVLAQHFNSYVEKAMDVLHGDEGTGYTRNNGEVQKPTVKTITDKDGNTWEETTTPGPSYTFDHYQLIGGIALAIQGNVPVENIQAFLKAYAIPAGTVPVADTVLGVLYNRKASSTKLNTNAIPYIVSRYIQLSKGHNPKVAGANQTAREEALMLILGDDKFEQQSANRLPGWDSTGCKEVLSQSLINKIRANELKKEREAEKKSAK
jgi:hypothetical protein